VFFMWPHTVGYLRDSEVIQHIVARARREHGIEFEPEVHGVLTELGDLERDFTRAAVFGGEGFQTVWRRDH
jgi:hypothetical protein